MRFDEKDSINQDGTYRFKGNKSNQNFTDYYDKAFNADSREEELGAEFAKGFHEEINIDIDPAKNTKKENPFQNPNYRPDNNGRYYDEYQFSQNPYGEYYHEDIRDFDRGYNNQNTRNGQADMNNTNDFGYEDRYTRRNNQRQTSRQNSKNQSRSSQSRNPHQRPDNNYKSRSQANKRPRTGYNEKDYDRDGGKREKYDSYSSRDKRNKKGKKKKKFSFKKLLLILLLIILILFGLASALILHYIDLMNLVDTGDRVANSASVISSDKVENILIIGSDSRSENENARSDSMILVSINKDTKQLVQTSFMRDMYVKIPGFGENKINAAYNNGGPELLMDTIEQNFNIQIDYYVQIDFFSFIDIIDALGGLDIKITKAEALAMIDPLGEQNKYLNNERGTDYLTKGGEIHMNGNQALAYARIRHIKGTTGTDFGRTDRQRKVLNMIMDKMKDASLTDINKMLENVLPKITSNMTKKQLYFLSLRAPFILSYDRIELRIPYGDEDSQPDERYWEYGTGADGSSILVVDFDKNSALLRKTIYGY